MIFRFSMHYKYESTNSVHITLPQPLSWRQVTAILAIKNTKYYTASIRHNSLGVSFERPKDATVETARTIACDVAAQTLLVAIQALGIPLQECRIEVKDFVSITSFTEALFLADEIWERANAASVPEDIPARQIIARGKAPAYWLRG